MKRMLVACLMFLMLAFFAADRSCLAADYPEETKKLAGYINEYLSPNQIPEIEALLDQGADVDVTNLKGRTLLMVASLFGQLDIARLLLDRGAQVDWETKNERGDTPYDLAVKKDFGEVLELLKTRQLKNSPLRI
jgi:ankyrin repeat protein